VGDGLRGSTIPGYGVAPGTATESSVNIAVENAYQFLLSQLRVKPELLLLMGRSVGTGPAILCASHHPQVAALILIAAYTSISDMVAEVPPCFGPVFALGIQRCASVCFEHWMHQQFPPKS
jgi:pimeloyl-ACP methyl ester carboxylesterase